jgi:hypothetical protein
VFIHHLVGVWCTDFPVSHTPKSVMFFGVLKSSVPLVVHAHPRQGLCPVISLCFFCSYAREYLFSRTCTCCLHWCDPSYFLDVSIQHYPHVHREGRNWLVDQDLIGVCHMHTYVHKKIPRHMKLRAHTRNTTNSSGKIAFSDSLKRQ